MNRRSFLRTTFATSIVLGTAQRAFAQDGGTGYVENIGLQLYTLRDALAKDPAATLQQVADAGYKQVELFGFPNCQSLIDGAKAAGLAIHSSHFEWDSVVNPKDEGFSDFKRILDRAKEVGIAHLVIPYLAEQNRRTLDDYRKVAENCNKAAAITKEMGIELGYHNHAFEFEPKDDGQTGFEVFEAEFSQDMHFELDVFWVHVGGVDPVELIRNLGGRVSQLHLKDLKNGIAVPNFRGLPQEAFQEIGDGVIAMKPILDAAANAGVKHCHVEQDHSPDAIASIRQSIAFLRDLQKRDSDSNK
jgi:sugar phosphate isomerase/epimerase